MRLYLVNKYDDTVQLPNGATEIIRDCLSVKELINWAAGEDLAARDANGQVWIRYVDPETEEWAIDTIENVNRMIKDGEI